MKKQKFAVLLMVILALVLGTVAVHAITIVVDGDRETAWDGVGATIPGLATDPNETGINDNVDIRNFRWTNDQTNFYFLVEVWGPPPLMPALAPIDICLDTDGLASTDIPITNSIQRDRCSYPTGVTGIDRVIEAYRLPSGLRIVDVYNVTVDPPIFIGPGTLGYAPASPVPVVEISVPLSLFGYGAGNCPGSIPMVVYYDGGDTNPDDNLPDSGTTAIGCGGPTAVSLQSFSAANSSSLPVYGLMGFAALAMVGVVALVLRRERKQA